eukprot:Gregarina_sp_Pseudo_9__1106@NODE_1720_length_1369_cov_16_693985_g1594_i0_p1_GENE_NODE_1720_length_1369_cov_16_693985_g1594_i0NODE_1720_length_1369_cov_16_693985_g1594_i0_p1_ORF_typecomplete_len403_score109_30Peptidase_M24/PF00557_24/8_9e35_NODE_1720_length_1369_cov_16_693985_g1594_i0201228
MEPELNEKFDQEANLTKYNGAADIATAVLKEVIAKCTPGASILQICEFGDTRIRELCDGSFNKKENGEKLKKGVAFPTCISVNEIIGHYSPMDESQEPSHLKEGDVVKIDLGAHIGGFPAIIGHTIVCGGEVTGRKADVIMAAWTAAEAALRAIKVGNTNYDVTHALEMGYTAYGCNGVHGVLHHEVGKYYVDGKNIIHNRNFQEERVEEFTFEPYQAFLLEVTASTGTGRARESPYPTLIYKRDIDNDHELRTLFARQFFSELQRNRPVFPFHSRDETDKNRRNVGIAECLKHYMIQAFPTVTEQAGEFVAKFVFTALIFPNGTKKLGGLPLDLTLIKSDKSIPPESPLKELLAKPYGPPSKAKKKKAKKSVSEGTTKETETETAGAEAETETAPPKETDN